MSQLVQAQAFDFVGVLIVVGVIVARIIAASKAQKPGRSTNNTTTNTPMRAVPRQAQARRSSSPTSVAGAPSALQQLLESLAGTQPATPQHTNVRPPSLPTPAPVTGNVPTPTLVEEPDPATCDPYLPHHVETKKTAPKKEVVHQEYDDEGAYDTKETHRNIIHSGSSLKFLKQSNALKQAILAHEILGPPRALQPRHANKW